MIKRRRGVRRGPWRSRPYRLWVARHRCVICHGAHPGEVYAEAQTQASHTVNNGTSSKGPDSSCLPLCLTHHDELDARIPMRYFGCLVVSNMTTKRQFEAVYGVSLKELAAEYFRRWEEECQAKSRRSKPAA